MARKPNLGLKFTLEEKSLFIFTLFRPNIGPVSCEKQWQTTHLAAPGSYYYLVNHFGGGIRTFVRMINVLYTEPTLWEVHYTVRRNGNGSARRHAKGTPDVCSGETCLTEQPWRNPKQGELP